MILQIIDYIYPDRFGGSYRYAYELAKLFDGEIVTLTMKSTKEGSDNHFMIHKILSKIDIISNVIQIKKKIDIDAFQKVIFHSILMLFLLGPYFLLKKKKIIMIYHGPWTLEFYYKAINKNGIYKSLIILFPVYYIIEYIANFYVDEYIFLSNMMKNDINEIFNISKKKFHVVPYFIDLQTQETLVQKNIKPPFKLLTIRRLEYRMGLQDLIKTISLVNEAYRPTLSIVGDGPYRYKLEDMVNKLNLNKFINFEGKLSDEELDKFKNNSDFFLLPSKNLEGFGIVVLESIENELPTIMSNKAGFSEYVVDDDLKKMFFVYQDNSELKKLLTTKCSITIDIEKINAVFGSKIIKKRFEQIFQ